MGRKTYMTGRGQTARLLRCNRLSFGRVPPLFGLLCSVHPRIKRAPPSPHGRAAMPCTGGTTRPIFAKSMAGQSTPPGHAHVQRRLPPRQGRHSRPRLVAAMSVSSRRRLYPADPTQAEHHHARSLLHTIYFELPLVHLDVDDTKRQILEHFRLNRGLRSPLGHASSSCGGCGSRGSAPR